VQDVRQVAHLTNAHEEAAWTTLAGVISFSAPAWSRSPYLDGHQGSALAAPRRAAGQRHSRDQVVSNDGYSVSPPSTNRMCPVM
jgi:hypothetical protein